MSCFHPLTAYRSKFLNDSGKRSPVFDKKLSIRPDAPFFLPCNQCSGCRLERSRQWAIRCMHEARLHKNNCFITLTYNDDHIPCDDNLIIGDFQKFMKRFRKKFQPKNPYYGGQNANPKKGLLAVPPSQDYLDFNKKYAIRFYHCGEYGPKLGRPHFHACIFNFNFDDQRLWKPKTKINEAMFRSKKLENLWKSTLKGDNHKTKIGYSCVQTLTFDSAAYCARYIMKKQTGEQATEHYMTEHGVLRNPEYNSMSRRPGLAKHYFDKYHEDWYNEDFLIADGKKHKIPKYYDAQYELLEPEKYNEIRLDRKLLSLNPKSVYNRTPERLIVREKVHLEKINTLKRTLDL